MSILIVCLLLGCSKKHEELGIPADYAPPPPVVDNSKAIRMEADALRDAIFRYQEQHVGNFPKDMNELVMKGYVKDISSYWTIEDGRIVRRRLDETQCLNINKSLGVNAIPSCSDPKVANTQICCTTETEKPLTHNGLVKNDTKDLPKK